MVNVNTNELRELAARIWTGCATDEELGKAKLADVIAIKRDAEHLHFRANVRGRNSVDREARTVEHVASDESADRMGDVIRVKGWELGPFKENAVLLRYHNNESPPLGKVLEARKDRSGDTPALVTRSQFFEDAKQNDEGRLLAMLVLDGDMPAVSVGFLPLETTYVEDEEERRELGLGRFGVVFERAELLELSVVTVPANANALMRKIDALAKSGAVGESLARATQELVQREFVPSTRTVVAVPRRIGTLVETELKVPTPEGNDSAPNVAAQLTDVTARLLDIGAAIGQLQTTLTRELAAVRAQLDRVTRAGDTGPATPEPPIPPNAETDPRVRAQAYGEALLKAAVDAVANRGPGRA